MAAAGSGGVEEEELDVVPGAAKFKLDDSQTPSSQQAKNLVRNVEVEQKWRDTEIAANTQFDFTNLSSLFVLIPGKYACVYQKFLLIDSLVLSILPYILTPQC